MWDIDWYAEDNGIPPVQEFLKNLNKRIIARFVWSLKRLRICTIAEQTIAEYLENQLWELQEERGHYRLLFSYCLDQCVVLLHGFSQRNNQKTSREELDVALQRLVNFTARKKLQLKRGR